MKANIEHRRLDFSSMVQQATSGEHEFFSYGLPKVLDGPAHHPTTFMVARRLCFSSTRAPHKFTNIIQQCARPMQVKVDLKQAPHEGDTVLWHREMCALYRRYMCIDPCESKRMPGGFGGLYHNTRSMFMVTARRLR